MKRCHLSTAAEDDGSVLLWKKQPGCHGRELNRSRALFSLKWEPSGRAGRRQQILLKQSLIGPNKDELLQRFTRFNFKHRIHETKEKLSK